MEIISENASANFDPHASREKLRELLRSQGSEALMRHMLRNKPVQPTEAQWAEMVDAYPAEVWEAMLDIRETLDSAGVRWAKP